MEKNPLKNRQSPEKEALRNQFSLHMTEISLSMGVNCTLVDRDNEALFRSDPTGGTNAMPMRLSCPFYMELGSRLRHEKIADVVTCPEGYLFAAAPIGHMEGYRGMILAGPFATTDQVKCPKPEAGICSLVRRTTHARAHAVAHLLNILIAELAGDDLFDKYEKERLFQSRLAIRAGMTALRRSSTPEEYPVALEDTLKEAILEGDSEKARAMINRILSHVFYAKTTAEDPDLVLTRLVELLTLMSRAAIAAGADGAHCLDMNTRAVHDAMELFGTDQKIEEVAVWLSAVLAGYTEVINKLGATRHGDMLAAVKNYILANYMRKLTLEDVAAQVYLSPTYLSKVFKTEVGVPFVRYLNEVRVEQSKYLLLFTDKSISEIYSLTGFEDQSYFTKVFKSIAGCSPGKFRESAGRPASK